MVEVNELRRTFSVRPRRRGVVGAVLDLFSGTTTEVTALDGVSFSIRPGEILGYIGPNGAGKSTTVKCLAGILKPSAGTVRVAGIDPWSDRRRHVWNTGAVFGQRTQLWWDLAVVESFDLLAALYQIPGANYQKRLEELDAVLNLGPLLRIPARELSLGQRVRCDLAAAMLHEPKVVLLDEPTIGLDVGVRAQVRKFIRAIAVERGAAVLLASHDLGDLEQLCDRVVMVHRGRTVFEGSLDSLRATTVADRRLVVRTARSIADHELTSLAARLGAEVERESESGFSIRVGTGAGPLVAEIVGCVPVADLSILDPPIEDVVARFFAQRDRAVT